jgi:hypothetical protein
LLVLRYCRDWEWTLWAGDCSCARDCCYYRSHWNSGLNDWEKDWWCEKGWNGREWNGRGWSAKEWNGREWSARGD